MDSQAVKNTCHASAASKGFCVYKATNGIKRHLAADTMGYPFMVYLTKASISDDTGLIEMLIKHQPFFENIPTNETVIILLDQGYHIDNIVRKLRKVIPHLMKKSDLNALRNRLVKKSGFQPVPKRWVVERYVAKV